jgi:hypothetical protein
MNGKTQLPHTAYNRIVLKISQNFKQKIVGVQNCNKYLLQSVECSNVVYTEGKRAHTTTYSGPKKYWEGGGTVVHWVEIAKNGPTIGQKWAL